MTMLEARRVVLGMGSRWLSPGELWGVCGLLHQRIPPAPPHPSGVPLPPLNGEGGGQQGGHCNAARSLWHFLVLPLPSV